MRRTKRYRIYGQKLRSMFWRLKIKVASLRPFQKNSGREKRKRIIIHIGTHKTGSTSIQNFLRRQSSQLKRCGILVPYSGTLSKRSGHHNIAWEIRSDPLFRDGCGGVKDLILELKAAREECAVISSEDFEYLLQYPFEMRQFHNVLVDIGYDPEYVVFFRNPSDYLQSLYHELKKPGQDVHMPFEWFENEFRTKGYILVNGDWYYELNYPRFTRNWQEIAGSKLSAFSYEDASKHPGLLPFFFEYIGASPGIVKASAKRPKLNKRAAVQTTVPKETPEPPRSPL